jgi:hypothetical protein
MKAKKVCRRCYGHAVSLEDVTAPTRMIRPYVVSPKGYVHKPVVETGKTECGWDYTRWGAE